MSIQVKKKKSKAVMSVLTLVMINIIAIDSLRGVPMGAHYGLSLIFYYVIAALTFFIPSALVSAELATALPQTGGIYVWVREAFGVRFGFLVIFIQWIYNVCWYPTVLSFLAAALAYLIDPKLASNVYYMLAVVLGSYWLLTIITLKGMRASGLLSTFAAILGTLVPLTFISILGAIWIWLGKPISIAANMHSLIPNMTDPTNLVLLTGIMYTLVGMEMSAVHAQDIKDPKRDYPRALLFSTIIILTSLILSSLAVAIVLPSKNLDILTGVLDAFALFLRYFGLSQLMPFVVIAIVIGVIGGVGAWMIGPTRGLLVAAQDGCVPKFLQKVNKKNMPVTLLLVQGVIASLLCLVFLVMPTVNGSFWILSDLTAQLALSCYLFLFAAAIYLRYKRPKLERPYKIPFGNVGMWIVSIFGILASLFTIFIGYFPPSQINVGSLTFYESFLIVGFVGFYAVPLLLYRFRRKSWVGTVIKEK